jgi:hypothetical protein
MTQIVPRDAIDSTDKCGIYTDEKQSYILVVSPAQKIESTGKVTPQQMIIEDGQIKIRRSSVQADHTLVWSEWASLSNTTPITSEQLEDGCVTTAKIAGNAVTEDKLDDALKTKLDWAGKSRYSAKPYNTGEKWLNGQDVWRADFAVVIKDEYQSEYPDDKNIHIARLVDDPALNINGTAGIIDIQAYSASATVNDPRQETPFLVDLCMIDIQQVESGASGWLYFHNQYPAMCNAVLLYGYVKYVKDYTLSPEHVTGIIDSGENS